MVKEKTAIKRLIALISALILTAISVLAPAARAEETEPVVLDTIEILGFTEPAWGAAADFEVSVPEGAHYYVDYTNWFWYIPGGETGMLPSDGAFTLENACYYQEFEIWPEEGYTFADDVLVYINGSAELVDRAVWSLSSPYFLVDTIDFTVHGPAALPGDADLNGEVNVSDALIVMRAAMGLMELEPAALEAADVNASGEADMADAVSILRAAMGLVEL